MMTEREIQPALPPEDVALILTHLSLPPSTTLPLAPIPFLSENIYKLPPPLLKLFGSVTTPRQRSHIPSIKSRRLVYATSIPPPITLSAERGRLRWPLLWERMGGISLPFLSSVPSNNHSDGTRGIDPLDEEEQFGNEGFMSSFPQHVKRLGVLLREYEEEREFEAVREARRVERRFEEVGEEFDSDTDDEGVGDGLRAGGQVIGGEVANQEDVRRAFERRLLELFVDGLDTIDYDAIDFAEPLNPDPTLVRDMEDAYFDAESPSLTPNGEHVNGGGTSGLSKDGLAEDITMRTENGEGEYDY